MYYDDLSRIESVYGSVAEYYRAMFEEQPDEIYEESYDEDYSYKEEQLENEISMAIYNKKIELLNGEPSSFAVSIKDRWDKVYDEKFGSFGDENEKYWAIRDFSKEKTLDMFNKICSHYSVIPAGEGESYYRPGMNKFGISVAYSDRGEINHKEITCLDYELFQDVFRDMHFAGLSPTMSYEYTAGHPMLLSNCSLGSLRIYDLKLAGLETEESINRELTEKGFDEQAIRNSVIGKYRVSEDALIGEQAENEHILGL